MDLPDVLRMFGMHVGDDDSAVDIRKAYRLALRQFHPDKLTGKSVKAQVRDNRAVC